MFCLQPLMTTFVTLTALAIIISTCQFVIASIDSDLKQEKRFAIVVTGQLGRLELISKIKNMIVPNLRLKNDVGVFLCLDGSREVKQSTQTMGSVGNLGTILYTRFSSENITAFVTSQIKYYLNLGGNLSPSSYGSFTVETRIDYETYSEYLHYDKVPFSAYKENKILLLDGVKRFNRHQVQLSRLRDACRMAMKQEVRERKFYDFFIVLRDDSYVVAEWKFNFIKYENYFSVLEYGSGKNLGLNDHNFIIGRLWVDEMLRGIVEDYYLNRNLTQISWFDPEFRYSVFARNAKVKVKLLTLCESPMLVLRGLRNPYNWNLHRYFNQLYLKGYKRDVTKCSHDELHAVLSSSNQTVPADDFYFVNKFMGLTFDEVNQAIKLQSGSLIKLENDVTESVWLLKNGITRKFVNDEQLKSYGYDLSNISIVALNEFQKYKVGIPFF